MTDKARSRLTAISIQSDSSLLTGVTGKIRRRLSGVSYKADSNKADSNKSDSNKSGSGRLFLVLESASFGFAPAFLASER
ncbi:MAG TPA: hypothetical protein PLX62_05340, partial [Bacteroidales bacterium]|nr:hypothetical protein [Bacteroidales bacterium]